MLLSDHQQKFAHDVAKLIETIYKNGQEVTFGESWRSDEQQAIYIKSGASKRKRSAHQDKLAIDLNLFIDNVYQTKTAAYKPLGKYWKSLDPLNIWGGDWGWDGNHFERKISVSLDTKKV